MSDKWTKEDEDLYQKKYQESLKELGEIYNPHTDHIDWNESIKKDEARKARDNMINFAKGKSANDKIQAVDDALMAVGTIGAAAKGAKDAKNAKSKAIPKSAKVADAVGEKMAAGAEGMSFTTPRESLHTDDLSANQFKNLRNGFHDAAEKIGVGNFALDPNVDTSDLPDTYGKKPKKVKPHDLKLTEAQRQESNAKTGWETNQERRGAAKKNYKHMMNEPDISILEDEPKDTHALDESIRIGKDVYERNHDGTPKRKANPQEEQQRVIEIANFMKDLEKTHPDWVKDIRANMRDLHLRDKKAGPRVDERLAKGLTSDKKLGGERDEDLLKSRVTPIANEMAQMMPEENLIGYGRRALGKEWVDSVLKNSTPEQAKKKIATGLAALTASMMYSEEKGDNGKMTNKIVAGNKEQLSGKNAPAWVKDKAKMWDGWFDTFDANKMDNEKDYQTYLEAYQLMDDYKRGNKIISNSGNTNPMAELLTTPKYIDLIMKYNPDDAKRVFGK